MPGKNAFVSSHFGDHPQLRGAKQGSLVLSRWALCGRLTALMSDAVVRDHAAGEGRREMPH